MAQIISTEVDVNAYYFAGKDMKSFPRQISYDGRAVTFADGLRVRLQCGERQTYFFEMSGADGGTYRLRQDGSRWLLVGAW